MPGYISKCALIPEENVGIIVLTNDMSSVPTLMMYALADWVDEKPMNQWIDTFYDFKVKGAEREAERDKKRLEGKKDDPKLLPLEDYAGRYRDEMYGDAVITLKGSELSIALEPTKELFAGKMQPWNDHAFSFEHNDPFLPYGIVTFDVEKDVIKGFTIELPNYDFHFNKLNFVPVKQ